MQKWPNRDQEWTSAKATDKIWMWSSQVAQYPYDQI